MMKVTARSLAACAFLLAGTAAAGNGTLHFVAQAVSVTESDGQVQVAVRRDVGQQGAVSVAWATSDGTALAGSDYQAASGVLQWADHEIGDKLITVTLPDDAVIEPAEVFNLTLSDAQGGAALGRSALKVTLRDDDSVYGFVQRSSHVAENGVAAQIGVSRSGHGLKAGSLHFTTLDGAARAGRDYQPATGTLDWAAGETGVKYFTVPVIDDAINERDESVILALDAPVNGAITDRGIAKLIIDNDDCPLADGTVVAHTWSGNAGTVVGGKIIEPATGKEPFTVPIGCRISSMTVRINWTTPAEDLDLYVTQPGGVVVSDASFQTNGKGEAQVTIPHPVEGGYLAQARGYIAARSPYTGTVTFTVGGTATTGQPPLPVGAGSGIDDAVVIAVVDTGINPYHFDFLAAYLPQNLNTDPNDDLPLDQDPSTWLPGYPAPSSFLSYDALHLTLTPGDPNASTTALHGTDQAEWSKILISEGTANAQVHMYWFPGTKIIGHVAFSGGSVGDPLFTTVAGLQTGPKDTWQAAAHGVGTASVSTGNLHGSCPQCLLVMVDGTGEQASEWVDRQDWIDLQSNSWGQATVYRERAYAGSDTELQRQTIERGQSIFFSAGNGQENAFVVPNATLLSSQEGPDWIVTVGATLPTDGSSYSGAGKPADVAGMGEGYPSAYGSGDTTTNEGPFSGTSNATPQIAGMYGEVLYRIRRMLPGPSRGQSGGVIASGTAKCGTANPDCALADGALTVHELRGALFGAAQRTAAGTNVGGLVPLPLTESKPELEMLSEGHGTYRGRVNGIDGYEEEVRRIGNFARGAYAQAEAAAQRDWFIADSICRQAAWGSWNFGESRKGAAPGFDPAWPVRSFYTQACPTVVPPIVAAEKLYWLGPLASP